MENRIDAIYARQSVDRKNRISRSILDFATIVNPKLTALNVELALKLLFSALYAITCVPLLSVAIVISFIDIIILVQYNVGIQMLFSVK